MIATRLCLFMLVTLGAATASAERMRTVIPRATVNYLSLPVAEVKGYFRGEGLDNETIAISGTNAIAALVSGDVDYSGAGGSGMRAAVRGAPIRPLCFKPKRLPGISWRPPTL